MCGITGLINGSSAQITQMNDAISHRGPDSDGVWSSGNVSLGHRRLAIIDLSPAGYMPMHTETGEVLIFNGEIYNYKQIRDELQQKGYEFTSDSDSEVLLKGYHEWGTELLSRINGMFAFALYDPEARTVFIARDRIGQKPLYYYHEQNTFAFSSELKSFVEANFALTKNTTAVLDYFTYGSIPHTKSFYNEVQKLLPGHYAIYDIESNTLSIDTYWKLSDALDSKNSTPATMAALESLLEQTVQDRLIADVPVANFLSGGIDSSSIAAMLHEVGRTDIEQIFISLPGRSDTDEDVQKLADTFGFTLTSLQVEELDYEGTLPKITAQYDEPMSDNSSVPTNIICKTARESDYTVVLSGDGGDELFAGYTRYRQIRILAAINRLRLQPLWKALHSLSKRFTGKRAVQCEKIFYTLSLKDIREQYIKLHGGFTREEKKHLLTDDLLEEHSTYNDYWLFDEYWREDLPLVKRCQYFDIMTSLPDRLLVKADRMSMAHSLELRAPFLDYRLYEHIFALNQSEYVRFRTLKYLLRQIMKKRLPDYILNKSKEGFGYNYNSYIIRELPQYMKKTAPDYLLRHKKIYYLNALNSIESNEKNS